jgi:hypothetical protein
MLTIAGLLFAALLPTYNFNFPSQNGVEITPEVFPKPADQAICYFRPGHTTSDSGNRAIANIILLVFGFLFRTVRLHKFLVDGAQGRLKRLGDFTIGKLHLMYNWCDIEQAPHGLKRTILYWPILAWRWNVQVAWDFLTSMYFEVSSLKLGSRTMLMSQGSFPDMRVRIWCPAISRCSRRC